MTRSLTSSPNSRKSVKFLYSYNGQILPRPSDGVLRYVGGHTRILSVDRSISFSELLVKFGELTGTSVNLKCKLPSEDLDVLISIKSDEELRNVIDEYDRASEFSHLELKIRAILSPVQSVKKLSSPSSPTRFQPLRMAAPAIYTPSPPSTPLSFNCSPTQSRLQPTKMAQGSCHQSPQRAGAYRCCSPPPPPQAVGYAAGIRKDARRNQCCRHGSPRQQYFIPYSNIYLLPIKP
ncbi:unnamed protein product [Coffea canephora]|uniref:PB1 domain-containing protein n=2 Tax=Coffea TaxID=13442 RepID=A0A068UW48_COFCA|nr:uncharacterized protein LOC113738640 [Coffea arabica]CDP12740.1 unnamed protein product [Coffea canephora]